MSPHVHDSTGLSNISPQTHPARDATHFRKVVATNERFAAAKQELAQAVDQARKAGDSWAIIGAALGVSRQAAQQRFG